MSSDLCGATTDGALLLTLLRKPTHVPAGGVYTTYGQLSSQSYVISIQVRLDHRIY